MSELPPGSISMADLYREITAMRAEVARALSQLEVINSRNTDADRLHADHEARLRVLEQSMPTNLEGRVTGLERMAWKMIGAFGAINGAAVLVEWLIWAKK